MAVIRWRLSSHHTVKAFWCGWGVYMSFSVAREREREREREKKKREIGIPCHGSRKENILNKQSTKSLDIASCLPARISKMIPSVYMTSSRQRLKGKLEPSVPVIQHMEASAFFLFPPVLAGLPSHEESRGRISAPICGWDCPLAFTSGFDCDNGESNM